MVPAGCSEATLVKRSAFHPSSITKRWLSCHLTSTYSGRCGPLWSTRFTTARVPAGTFMFPACSSFTCTMSPRARAAVLVCVVILLLLLCGVFLVGNELVEHADGCRVRIQRPGVARWGVPNGDVQVACLLPQRCNGGVVPLSEGLEAVGGVHGVLLLSVCSLSVAHLRVSAQPSSGAAHAC